MTTRHHTGLASLGLLLLFTGCATVHKRVEIPLGQWSGQGMFVSAGESDKDSEDGGALSMLEHGYYPTRLTIDAAPEAGPGAVCIEILSERHGYESLEGDRTHLVAYLVPMINVADDAIALYYLDKIGLSFDEKKPELARDSDVRMRASCMLVDGNLVLRIHYRDDFVDIFRFRDNFVYKDGMYAPLSKSKDEKFGFIHWSEVLHHDE